MDRSGANTSHKYVRCVRRARARPRVSPDAPPPDGRCVPRRRRRARHCGSSVGCTGKPRELLHLAVCMMLSDTDRKPSADLQNTLEPDTPTEGVGDDARRFGNPIANEGGGGADDSSGGEPLVDLPDSVLNLMQLALGGPGSPSTAKAWLWHFFALAGLWSTAYGAARLYMVVDESLTHAALPWFVFCLISGAAWGATVHDRWLSYGPTSHSDDPSVRWQRGGLRELLKHCAVNQDQVAAMLRWARLTRASMVGISTMLCVMICMATYYPHKIGILTTDIAVAFAIMFVSWPVSVTTLFGGIFMDCIARTVLVGRLEPIVDRVKKSRPDTTDFDVLLTDIIDAEQQIMTVSENLERPIVMQIVAHATAGFACMLIGLGPHPSDADHWWRQIQMSHLILFIGITWFLSSLVLLFQASKVTSMCDRLGDCVNKMTETPRQPGQAIRRMPTLEQQRNIEHLCGYVRGLNRGRGMGFVLYHKRISHSFVVALSMKVVSVMTISFPVILSLTRVEEAEEEILNRTEFCAGV